MGGLEKLLKKRWGVVVLVVAILGWASEIFGPVVLMTLSAVSVLYFLFQAPLWCTALGRQGRCRNNANGMLRGCHLREHKWQGLRLLLGRGVDRQLQGVLFADRQQGMATLGVAISAVSMFIAFADFVFKGWA